MVTHSSILANKAKADIFLELPFLRDAMNVGDMICLFKIQILHLGVLGSSTVEA